VKYNLNDTISQNKPKKFHSSQLSSETGTNKKGPPRIQINLE